MKTLNSLASMEPRIDDGSRILQPGPSDASLLTRQQHHRSHAIWNGEDSGPLTCRGRTKEMANIQMRDNRYWAWARLPFLCPRIEPAPGCDYGPWPYAPLAVKWVRVPGSKSRPSGMALVVYREQLVTMQPNQIVWQPYEAHFAHLPDFCVAGRGSREHNHIRRILYTVAGLGGDPAATGQSNNRTELESATPAAPSTSAAPVTTPTRGRRDTASTSTSTSTSVARGRGRHATASPSTSTARGRGRPAPASPSPTAARGRGRHATTPRVVSSHEIPAPILHASPHPEIPPPIPAVSPQSEVPPPVVDISPQPEVLPPIPHASPQSEVPPPMVDASPQPEVHSPTPPSSFDLGMHSQLTPPLHPETPLYPPTSSSAPTLSIDPPRTEPMTMIPIPGLYTEHHYPPTSSSSDPIGHSVGTDTPQADTDVPDENPPPQPSPPRGRPQRARRAPTCGTGGHKIGHKHSSMHEDEPKDDAPQPPPPPKHYTRQKVTEALKRAGLESSSLIVGIDFTKSNEWTGARSFNRRSLHHVGDEQNPYEQAISIIGKTLSSFDEDNLIPYHVLLIIADGQVTRSVDTERGDLSPQEKRTVDAIVKASEYPLSIVLVGVGDGPWDMMREFDDNIPARAFDNFQFVNFTEIMSKNMDRSRKEAEFALAALMEIPSQYKATLELNILG
nr:e3 ubiquitin-protein ligase rglg5 [Quercus suber]